MEQVNFMLEAAASWQDWASTAATESVEAARAHAHGLREVVFDVGAAAAVYLLGGRDSEVFHWCLEWMDSTTEFQAKLLREFSLILLGNVALVLVAWKVYGPRIAERFMQYDCGSVDDGKETARREIEDLRSGLSELNLPKEQDFRFR